MRKEVIMPKIGLDMEEGTILEWKKKAGDTVSKGEVLLEIDDRIPKKFTVQSLIHNYFNQSGGRYNRRISHHEFFLG